MRQPLEIDLLGSAYVAQAVLPSMVKARRGSLILIGSTPAITGDRVGISYLVAKAGILGLTRALALRYGPNGVRVNAVALGSISTDPMQVLSSEETRALAEETCRSASPCWSDDSLAGPDSRLTCHALLSARSAAR